MNHFFRPITWCLIVQWTSRWISILFFLVCTALALFSLTACSNSELATQQSDVKSDLAHTPTADSAKVNSDEPSSTQVPKLEPTQPANRLQSFTIGNPRGLPLASFPLQHFEVGIGSGAFHAPTEEQHFIYVVTDNGPSDKCGKMSDKLGIAQVQLCPDDKEAQIAFVPTIYHLSLNQDGTAEVLQAIPLSHELGSPIAGFDNLRRIEKSDQKENGELADQLDIEAIVRLSDGTFWLAEEKTPSLLHVAADGHILKRFVPPAEVESLAAASYPVEGVLPAVLSALYDEKGIEALALSPDEQYLYFTTQAPLAHPFDTSSKESRQVRIFKFDWQGKQIVGTFLYVLDAADSYQPNDKEESVYISAMAAIGADQLLLVERAKVQTRVYFVDLASASPLDALYGDAAIRPTLEESSLEDIYAQGIQALDKQLVVELASMDTSKIEGLAVINAQTLILVNDTDFGKEEIDKPIIELVLPQEVGAKASQNVLSTVPIDTEQQID